MNALAYQTDGTLKLIFIHEKNKLLKIQQQQLSI